MKFILREEIRVSAMNTLFKSSILLLALFAAVQMAKAMDRPNPARWVPQNIMDTSSPTIVAINQTLLETIAKSNLTLASVQSFASRQIMVGNEYRAIYNASSTQNSTQYNCTTRVFASWYIPTRPVHTGILSHDCVAK